MCGILAIIGRDSSGKAAERALDKLSHRGPDDSGIVTFPQAILGATRLAFVDLSPLGHQPMKDEERDVAIAFNGEIYNYKELRKGLEEKGRRFKSESDTEVVLALYIEYGQECVKYLNGMFAFTIWDEKKQELFLARDRFGEKPLYFAHDPQGRLVVASEIKALFAAGVAGEIDPVGIDLYLALTYVPPWRSIYKNVHVILPAHRGVYKNDSIRTEQYWQLEHKPLNISYEEAKQELRRLLADAVPKRLIADVEIGSFLSGGVDSTLVTAYAQRGRSNRIKTFALGYDDYINELPYAEDASKKIGTDHRVLRANGEMIEELEAVLGYFDEPHGDSADLAQHLLAKETSKYVKAALSGDGGDELFLGYGWYWNYWHTSKISRVKNFLLSNPFSEHLKLITAFPESMRKSILHDGAYTGVERLDMLVQDIPGNGIEKINLFDILTYLPGQLLTKVDQTSMMHSLEVRSPFLDHKLAEFAFNLPMEYKTNHISGKLILKDVLAEIMPREFVDRKKQGFGAPIDQWLNEEKIKAYVQKELGRGAPVYRLLNEDVVQKVLIQLQKSNKRKDLYRIWTLLCLAVWARMHQNSF